LRRFGLQPRESGRASARQFTPHAFVVLRDGASATEADLIEFVRERLAHFKAPRAVTVVSELPKTATGKIQKFVLRKGAPNLVHQ
jgi:fatty-acyl-CoA synthase